MSRITGEIHSERGVMATAALYDFNSACHLKSNRRENQKSGFVPMYRSILKQSWRKDVYLRTLWQDLLFAAQKEPRRVNFRGHDWQLNTGQLVTTLDDLGTNLCNREGYPASRHAVKRMLTVFVKERMITLHTEHRKGTVITLLNYSEYNQKINKLPAHNPAHNTAPDKPSVNQASVSGDACRAGHYPAHHEQQYINNNKTLTSGSADRSSGKSAANPLALRAGAAIQRGKKWGTAEDLRAAEWLFGKVQEILPTAKQPNYASWANDIRLMRERDNRTHKEICQLFKWACQDSFWQGNVLCPDKLREKWDQLAIKRARQQDNTGQTGHQAVPHWNSPESWEEFI